MDLHPDLQRWRLAQGVLRAEETLDRLSREGASSSSRVHALVEQSNAIQRGRVPTVEVSPTFYLGERRVLVETQKYTDKPLDDLMKSRSSGVLDMFNWKEADGNDDFGEVIAINAGLAAKYKQQLTHAPPIPSYMGELITPPEDLAKLKTLLEPVPGEPVGGEVRVGMRYRPDKTGTDFGPVQAPPEAFAADAQGLGELAAAAQVGDVVRSALTSESVVGPQQAAEGSAGSAEQRVDAEKQAHEEKAAEKSAEDQAAAQEIAYDNGDVEETDGFHHDPIAEIAHQAGVAVSAVSDAALKGLKTVSRITGPPLQAIAKGVANVIGSVGRTPLDGFRALADQLPSGGDELAGGHVEEAAAGNVQRDIDREAGVAAGAAAQRQGPSGPVVNIGSLIGTITPIMKRYLDIMDVVTPDLQERMRGSTDQIVELMDILENGEMNGQPLVGQAAEIVNVIEEEIHNMLRMFGEYNAVRPGGVGSAPSNAAHQPAYQQPPVDVGRQAAIDPRVAAQSAMIDRVIAERTAATEARRKAEARAAARAEQAAADAAADAAEQAYEQELAMNDIVAAPEAVAAGGIRRRRETARERELRELAEDTAAEAGRPPRRMRMQSSGPRPAAGKGMPKRARSPSGDIDLPAHRIKGSEAARAHMAKLRAMRVKRNP